jgi:pyruvate formate lyase activating enzyme
MDDLFPLIVDVKRGATEDGPGIRTTIFFKGCPLSCVWCQNPETIDPRLEIGFFLKRCIGCGECVRACPKGAIEPDRTERIIRTNCSRCGACVDVCPSLALQRIGERYEVQALVDVILRDRVFYEASSGGVSLCGGEPALWPEYAGTLLRELKKEGIHTALETCGHFDYAAVEANMLPWLDLVLFDLKIMNSADHRRYTGKGNELILNNFIRLLDFGVEILPRTPLIPGYTASHENLTEIEHFLARHRITSHTILPYNPLGFSKWASLGKIGTEITQERDS